MAQANETDVYGPSRPEIPYPELAKWTLLLLDPHFRDTAAHGERGAVLMIPEQDIAMVSGRVTHLDEATDVARAVWRTNPLRPSMFPLFGACLATHLNLAATREPFGTKDLAFVSTEVPTAQFIDHIDAAVYSRQNLRGKDVAVYAEKLVDGILVRVPLFYYFPTDVNEQGNYIDLEFRFIDRNDSLTHLVMTYLLLGCPWAPEGIPRETSGPENLPS